MSPVGTQEKSGAHQLTSVPDAVDGSPPTASRLGAKVMGYDIRNFDDLEFVPLAEGSPVQMAVLWGDPATGPSGFVVRFPPGFEAPMHSHTSGYRAVVLEGPTLHWIDGETKADVEALTRGGYWFQPAGQGHADANPSEEPTVDLIIFDGPSNFVPAE